MKTVNLAMLAIVSCASLMSLANAADVSTVTVEYRDLNLRDSKDVAQLYGRLRVASQQVCAHLEGGNPSRKVFWQDCMSSSLTRAVDQVNSAGLTALHQRTRREGSPFMLTPNTRLAKNQ